MIDKISKKIGDIAEVVASLMLGAMATIVFLQVVLRYIFNSGIIWGDQFARYSTIWAVMLAANVLIRNEELIKVDFFDTMWPKSFLKIREVIYQVIFLFIMLLLVIKGWENSVDALKSIIPGLKLSWFWVYLSIPVGASLMLFQYSFKIAAKFFRESEDKV